MPAPCVPAAPRETGRAGVFFSEPIAQGFYGVCWRVSDDHQARQALADLQICPGAIELHRQDQWQDAQTLHSDVYSCLLRGDAHRLLRIHDLLALYCTLD